MDEDVISGKLESLRRCLARLKSKLPVTSEVLRSDYDVQDIIALNLERAVQVCVDIATHVVSETEVPPPRTMGEGFAHLAELNIMAPEIAERMQKAVAFRNILVHNYTDINWDIVARIVTHHLSNFEAFAQSIDRIYDDSR